MRFIPFKNVSVYRLASQIAEPVDVLNGLLAVYPFQDCPPHSMASTGWLPSPVNPDLLVHEDGDWLYLVVQKEARMLPASVIRDETRRRVEKIESQQARYLKKTEKDALKDESLSSLMPRAFTKKSQTRILINRRERLVFIDTASARRCEDALAILRKSRGTLPIIPFNTTGRIETVVTEWLKEDKPPANFTPFDDVMLGSMLSASESARIKGYDLFSDEIRSHIDAGKVVCEVNISWGDKGTFLLSDGLTLKRLNFTDDGAAPNDREEDAGVRFAADLLLFTSSLMALFTELVEAFGGEAKY